MSTPTQGDIDNLQSQINTLSSRLSSAVLVNTGQASDILALQGRASALEGRCATLESRCTALESRCTAAEGRLTAVEGTANNLASQVVVTPAGTQIAGGFTVKKPVIASP